MPSLGLHATTSITKLPPLILHPFSDQSGPNRLVESSRASLMLQGLLPSGHLTQQQLDRTLLDGRYCEIRMLYYVGKDITRWIEQCLEAVEHEETLKNSGIEFQSFAQLLVEDPPAPVRAKLGKWGVSDYKAIFARALGLNAMFAEAPDRLVLSDEFIRNYYRYADHLFACRQRLRTFTEISADRFDFDLYASGEYSRMLERQWEEQ
jgi:hypothetical protein